MNGRKLSRKFAEISNTNGETLFHIESCGLAVEHSAQDQKVVGFDPFPMLDGSGVKAMPGSISAPNSGSLQKIRK